MRLTMQRNPQLVLYMLAFVMVVYHVTEQAMRAVVEKDGHEAARRLVKEAAASIM